MSDTKTTNIAVSPQHTIPGRPLEQDMHRKMFRVQPDFPLDAVVRLVSGTNPWRHNGMGWRFYELVLRHNSGKTVEEIQRIALKDAWIGPYEVMEHLRWLFTWGGSYVEIGGELFTPPPPGLELPKRPSGRVKRAR